MLRGRGPCAAIVAVVAITGPVYSGPSEGREELRATDEWIGREILGYRLESFVGRGGMGVVYRAHDLRLKRSVALKLVAPELSQDERFRERFLAETELVTSLEHPNVVPIYDAGDVDGRLYLAMRFVEGSDLKALLAREGPLEPAKAVAIAAQVGAALDAAHEHGLVHRDVKPSNILLDARGHAYLTDFGLARRSGSWRCLSRRRCLWGHLPMRRRSRSRVATSTGGRTCMRSVVADQCLAGTVPIRADRSWPCLGSPAGGAAGDSCISAAGARRVDGAGEGSRRPLPDLRASWSRRHGRRSGYATSLSSAIADPCCWSRSARWSWWGHSQPTRPPLGGGGPSKPSTKPTISPKVDSLQRIDPKTNKLAATIGIGRLPTAVAVEPERSGPDESPPEKSIASIREIRSPAR